MKKKSCKKDQKGKLVKELLVGSSKNPDKARLQVNFSERKKLTYSWQPFPLHTLSLR